MLWYDQLEARMVMRVDQLNAGKKSDWRNFQIIFLEDRFYPHVEFYGWKT